MKHFRKYVRKYWKMFLLAIFFLALEAMADLMMPTLIKHIIDDGVTRGSIDTVLNWGGIMLGITAVGAVGAASRNVIASRVSHAFGAELRSDLFRKIQKLSFANLDKFERASLITRMTNDVTQLQNFINGLMRIFTKAPIVAIGGLIMAAQLDARLATVFAVVVPLIGLLIFISMRLGFPRFMRVQEALDQVNRVMREYLSGVRVVRAFNRFEYEVDKFTKTNREFKDRSVRVMRIMSLFNPMIMLVLNLGIAAVIWIGALWVDAGTLEVGVIVAFTNYMTQILFSMMMISMVFNMFIRAKASAVRIADVFAEEDAVTWEKTALPDGADRGAVEFDRVTFAYEKAEVPVLREVSFRVEAGTTVGIIGSTGSGKTSLVSLIPRFYDAVSGTVRVGGEDVRRIEPRALRERIAVVPQKSVLFTGTIADNIRWGKEDASMEEIERAARLAEAHPFIAELPEGYDTLLGQRGVNLSGGQKQRLSIARALVRNPDILILDDCTSAVDVATEARIKEALKRYAKGLTCLIIAQRITSVMDADQIIVLDNGEIVGQGTHESLLAGCRVYQEIYHSQIGKEMRTYEGA
jgi:ATP-binding cassette subfamily B protein